MRIAVVAANGQTGKRFVEAALAHGHTVTAGVRGENPFPQHPRLTVVECDAMRPSDVRHLLKNQAVVASFLGHVKGSPAFMQTDSMKVITTVMEEYGISRIVSLTGTGVRFPSDIITLMDRLVTLFIRLIDKKRVVDGIAHVEVLKNSSLDWTVLRVLRLVNTPPTPFTLRRHGPAKRLASRQEVAQAALEVIETGTFIKQAPIVSES